MNFNDPFAHGAYLMWDAGALKFDSIEEEEVERDADIVEHPIEAGGTVVDHYRVKMRTVKLNAFVSQEPIDPSLYPEMDGSVQTVELALPEYPTPSLASALFKGFTNPDGLIIQSLARKPPTTFNDRVLVYNNPIDVLAKVLDVLDDLYANATLIDVATRSRYYAQHLLGPATTKKNFGTGTGAIITLELRQVAFVSTEAVALPPTPVKKKDTPKIDKGKQNGTPPLQSAAVKLVDGVSKFFSGGSSTGLGFFP